MSEPGHGDMNAIGFAERMLNLLDRGSFVATYKYAVLLGLIDLCMECTSKTGAPPAMLTTLQLADKVLELYWPQATPYAAGGEALVLKQNSGSQAKILRTIMTFQESLSSSSASAHQARMENPSGFERMLREIEWILISMPLPRVQVIGRQEVRILYDINWDLNIKKGSVTRYQNTGAGEFDNRIIFRPMAPEYLVMLSGLLRPLIHREWVAMVAQINKLEESQLETFLFGAARIQLARVKPGLMELQDNRCFYCREKLGRNVEVDHFIPWSRYPDNGIENLVAAHRKCNNAKRDFLAATVHVHSWAGRNAPGSTCADDMSLIAKNAGWETCPSRTLGVARAIYLRLPREARLWKQQDFFETADLPGLKAALG